MEQFLNSDPAKALRSDLVRHAMDGAPDRAGAVLMLIGAAAVILEQTFPPRIVGELIMTATATAMQMAEPAGSA